MLRLVLVGPTLSGKSSIIARYVTHEFKDIMHPTLGVDFMIKIITVNGINVKLQIVK